MRREEFLKMCATAGTGLLAAGMGYWLEGGPSRHIAVISDSPSGDSRRLSALRYAAEDIVCSELPGPGVAQDLTVLCDGTVLDPLRPGEPDPELRAFARELRSRRAPGGFLIFTRHSAPAGDDEIQFSVDGLVVERIPRSRSYQRIVIDGKVGQTEFRLTNGVLIAVTSSCSHKVCVRTGPIRSGQIICAPNRLVASLGAGHGLDGIIG